MQKFLKINGKNQYLLPLQFKHKILLFAPEKNENEACYTLETKEFYLITPSSSKPNAFYFVHSNKSVSIVEVTDDNTLQ